MARDTKHLNLMQHRVNLMKSLFEVLQRRSEKNKGLGCYTQALDLFGRNERIRTSDPLHPMQVFFDSLSY